MRVSERGKNWFLFMRSRAEVIAFQIVSPGRYFFSLQEKVDKLDGWCLTAFPSSVHEQFWALCNTEVTSQDCGHNQHVAVRGYLETFLKKKHLDK